VRPRGAAFVRRTAISGNGSFQFGEHLSNLDQLFGCHRREIFFLQDFTRRKRECRVELDLARLFAFRRRFRVHQCLREPRRQLRHLSIAEAPVNSRQQLGQHSFQKLRVAPKHVERLLEKLQMIATRDQDRAQRGAKIDPPIDADRLNRGECVESPRRPHGQPRGAQDADEMNDILCETRRRHSRMPSVFASATSVVATSGPRRAISS
jgi:hypothetical protein